MTKIKKTYFIGVGLIVRSMCFFRLFFIKILASTNGSGLLYNPQPFLYGFIKLYLFESASSANCAKKIVYYNYESYQYTRTLGFT